MLIASTDKIGCVSLYEESGDSGADRDWLVWTFADLLIVFVGPTYVHEPASSKFMVTCKRACRGVMRPRDHCVVARLIAR